MTAKLSLQHQLATQRRKNANVGFEMWRHQMALHELDKDRPRRPNRGHVAQMCREIILARKQAAVNQQISSKECLELRPIVSSISSAFKPCAQKNLPYRQSELARVAPTRTRSLARPQSAGAVLRAPSIQSVRRDGVHVQAMSSRQSRNCQSFRDPRIPQELLGRSCSDPNMSQETLDCTQDMEVGISHIDERNKLDFGGRFPHGDAAITDSRSCVLHGIDSLTGDVLQKAFDDATLSGNASAQVKRPASAPVTRARKSFTKPQLPSQQSEAAQAILRGEIRLGTVPDHVAYIYMETENRRAFPPREKSTPAIQVRSDRNVPTAPV